VRRFVLEAKSASSLSHPNIVTIYEIGQEAVRSPGSPDSDPVHFISMELVSGKTLGALIHEDKADLRTLVGYLAQAAEGLAKAHASGIVHRDLKPGNIMVSSDGFAKVLDFGLAKLTEKREGSDITEDPTLAADGSAVGSVVGQLAKAWDCRAVGIAGGRQKCDYVTKELGFDACVDYKADNVYRDLKEACPKGIDVSFENVGGEIMDTVFRLMNFRSRMIVCGLVSEYNATEPYGVKNFRSILVNRIKVQGMIVFDWLERYPEGNKALLDLVVAGKLKYRESVLEGIESAPRGLIGLLKGQNFGKQLIKLA